MKVAFFSSEAGRNAVSSNLACVAVMGALCKEEKTVIFENHRNDNSLEHAFFAAGQAPSVRERDGYLCQDGLDGLVRCLNSGFMRPAMVEGAALSVMQKQLYYIPGSHLLDTGLYRHEMEKVMKPLFSLLEDFAENVFIDAGSGENAGTRLILEEADLIVANLNQNPWSVQYFFQTYEAFLEKTVFLMGGYQPASKFQMEGLLRKYPVPRKRVGVVPYHVGLHDAMQEGRLVPYLVRNFRSVRGEDAHQLMQALKKAAEMVFSAMEERKMEAKKMEEKRAGEKRIGENQIGESWIKEKWEKEERTAENRIKENRIEADWTAENRLDKAWLEVKHTEEKWAGKKRMEEEWKDREPLEERQIEEKRPDRKRAGRKRIRERVVRNAESYLE